MWTVRLEPQNLTSSDIATTFRLHARSLFGTRRCGSWVFSHDEKTTTCFTCRKTCTLCGGPIDNFSNLAAGTCQHCTALEDRGDTEERQQITVDNMIKNYEPPELALPKPAFFVISCGCERVCFKW